MRFLHHLLALGTLLLMSSLAWADGMIVIHGPHGIVLPPGHPTFAPLQIEYHHVTCTIKDQVAVTEVDQSFFNPSSQRLEGDYIFPIPAGGHIDKFAMDIDGKMVEAELLDATKARQIYEDIVRKAKDPALLEYVGQDLFRMRVFPIEPKASKHIKLKYTQVLKSEAGLVNYKYPLNTEKFSSIPIKSVSVKVQLETTRPIKSIYSPSHVIDTARHGEKNAVVGFEVSNQRPDTDFSLYFSTRRDNAGDVDLSLLTYKDGSDGSGGGYFLLLASAPWTQEKDKAAKKDAIFILDTSGSMAGDKMEQARRALKFCINNLNAGDHFQIVRFSTEAEQLFDGLVDADKSHRDKAEAFVNDLKATGGTDINGALGLAIEAIKKRTDQSRPCVVIFLTDGRPTIGTTDEETILANMTKAVGAATVRVFCFGIGNDVNAHLLDKIATSTRAASQYVLPNEDIEVKVSSFYAKVSTPVLSNLKLDFTNVRVSKVYPNPLPDLFEGDQLVLSGRYTGAGDGAIVLEGEVNGKAQRIVLEGKFADKSSENSFIPRIWATRRVGYLLDEIRLHGENAELRDETTQLARQYGIVTPYTAYLIVEDEGRRNVPILSRTFRGAAGPSAEAGAVREELGRAGGDFRMAKSGYSGVAAAQQADELKNAIHDAPAVVGAAATAPGSRAQTNMRLAMGDGAKDDKERADRSRTGQMLNEAQQNARFVRGRTFFQNGRQWVDSNVQQASAQNNKRVQVKFKLRRLLRPAQEAPGCGGLAVGRPERPGAHRRHGV